MNQLNFLQALGWALVSSLWQMAVLWIIYQSITGIAKGMNPGKKVMLATTLIISGFTWFIFTFITSLFSPHPFSIEVITDRYNLSGTAWQRSTQFLVPAAAGAYLLFLIFPVWNFFRNYKYVELIRTRGIQKMNAGWRIFVKRTAIAMGIVKQVQIMLSELVTSPVTIGYLKPIILVPAAIVNNLTPQQLEAIILHELTHIYRNDYLFNFIINIIRTILYFNPFVKQLVKSIEKEREKSCDEMVMQHQYRPGEYASALLRLERNKQYSMTLAAAGKDHDLLHRIEIILGLQRRREHPFRKISFAVITLIGIIFFTVAFSLKSVPDENNYQLAENNNVNPYFLASSKPVNFSENKQDFSASKVSGFKKSNIATVNEDAPAEISSVSPAMPGIYQANYYTPVIPELAPKEETNVKATINATRKILEESEWKKMEKCYADAFNSSEKASLKNEYKKEMETKVDWENLENKLRLSYDHLNWDLINEQLNTALAEIKVDSIQQQLNISLSNLAGLEKLLKANHVSSIPDSDISLTEIMQRQNQVKLQLEKVKSMKAKKIIRL